MPDDQRAAIALRVSDRRTVLSKIERAQKAGDARVATAIRDDQGQMNIQLGGRRGPPKLALRHRKSVFDQERCAQRSSSARCPECRRPAKQAAVSEKKIRAVAAIGNENPDAYQRIVKASAPTAARRTPRLTLY